MSAVIEGFETFTPEARQAVKAVVEAFGGQINVISVPDEAVAVNGLILATKPDFFEYNDGLDAPVPRSAVGRCWGAPHTGWSVYMNYKDKDVSSYSYYKQTIEAGRSLPGFDALFYDDQHMNVRVLDRVLRAGMTSKIKQLGEKSYTFLRGFTDWRLLQEGQSTTPLVTQA